MDWGESLSQTGLPARDASFLFPVRITIPGTQTEAAALPSVAQGSHTNDNYKGYRAKIPGRPRREYRNAESLTEGEDS